MDEHTSSSVFRLGVVAKALADASQNRLTADCTDHEGIWVKVAERCPDTEKGLETKASIRRDPITESEPGHGMTLSRGSLVAECPAIRIALESKCWTTNCGFCACSSTNITLCNKCKVIGFCSACIVCHREEHSKECTAIQTLVSLSQGELTDDFDATSLPELIIPDFSSHLLSVRLLFAKDDNGWWDLFDCLYEADIPIYEANNAKTISMFLQRIEDVPRRLSKKESILETYKGVLGRVLGCSHAVTDLSLPLGSQTLGRAIFLQHSFYNHSCAPNAFLSCQMPSNLEAKALKEKGRDITTKPSLNANIHLLQDLSIGEAICLSYIPLSGLSLQERESRLQDHYGFRCHCSHCDQKISNEADITSINLPLDADADAVREIQYSCSERMLDLRKKLGRHGTKCNATIQNEEDEDELDSILSLVRMTQRGIKNQGIPANHEISIEAHRLLAMGYSMKGQFSAAIQHHELFIRQVMTIHSLFDPVASATQRIAYAEDLLRSKNPASQDCTLKEDRLAMELWETALDMLQVAIGKDHSWVQSLFDSAPKVLRTTVEPLSKKQKK